MRKPITPSGFRIRELRESLKYSREAFAEKAGISPDFLYHIETTKKDFTTETLKKLCNAFCVSSDYILFGVQNQNQHIEFLLNQMDDNQKSLALDILKIIIIKI